MTHMTDEQKDSLRQIMMYLWDDEINDFENAMTEQHIFECLLDLREFLEQEGVEVFPEPDWHKAIEGKPLKM